MCDKKELTKDERLVKGKALIEEINSLELSDEELNEINAGMIESNIKTPGVYLKAEDDSDVGIGMSGKGTF